MWSRIASRSPRSATGTTSSPPSSTAASNRSSSPTPPDEEHAVPYTADKPITPPTPEELRARIPGWGVDADPADRPSVPRERLDGSGTGAHWDFPESQSEIWPRERSIEHGRLTPV